MTKAGSEVKRVRDAIAQDPANAEVIISSSSLLRIQKIRELRRLGLPDGVKQVHRGGIHRTGGRSYRHNIDTDEYTGEASAGSTPQGRSFMERIRSLRRQKDGDKKVNDLLLERFRRGSSGSF